MSIMRAYNFLLGNLSMRFTTQLFVLLSMVFLVGCMKEQDTTDYQAELKKKQNAAAYNIQLGLNYLKQGDVPRAKKKLLNAFELSPQSADVSSALGYYFEKTGEMTEAKNYYQQAMKYAPKKGAELNNYGAFLCRTGQQDEAERYFLKATEDKRYVHTAAAFENAGLCALTISNSTKAVHYFKKALEHDPQRKQALYELAALELKDKHFTSLLAYIQHQQGWFEDPKLLSFGIRAAEQSGDKKLVTDYTKRLAQLNDPASNYIGVKNDDNHHIG